LRNPRKRTVEFVEAGEDAAEALESAKQSFYFVALAVEGLVVLPRFQAIALGRNHGDKSEIQCQLPGFVVFVGTVHDQMQGRRQRSDAAQQEAALLRIGGLTGRQREAYGRSSIRGNQMNLGGPSAARFADGLGTVFFKAPVPSGCTLTVVESSLTAVMVMRTICSRCNCSKRRSKTPFLDQRFMRV